MEPAIDTQLVRKHVGARLCIAREAQSLSRAELSLRVGTMERDIDWYEQGAVWIPPPRLYDLSAALQVPVDFFFEGLVNVEAGHDAVDSISDDKDEGLHLPVEIYKNSPKSVRTQILGIAELLANNK